MNMNQLPIPAIRVGLQIVSGLGVSKILGDIIKNNVAITTTTEKVLVKTGAFVLGSMLWEQSSNHIERSIQDGLAWFEKQEEEVEEIVDPSKVNGS